MNTDVNATVNPDRTEHAITSSADTLLTPLDAGLGARVDKQVDHFLQGLLSADVMGEDFKRRIDATFRLGRKEIAEATRLNTSFTQRNFRGLETSPAYAAMTDLRI